MRDSFGVFLQEMGRIPLLTAAEELHLAGLIQAGLHGDPNDRRLQRRAARAKRRMVEGNIRLVISVAKRSQFKGADAGLELLDLVQEGAIGLNRAAEKFEPSRGYKFSTYAFWWISQAIGRAIAYGTGGKRSMRLPGNVLSDIAKVRRAHADASAQGQQLSWTEAAATVGIDEVRAGKALTAHHRSLAVSADSVTTESGGRLVDLLVDPNTPEVEDLDRELTTAAFERLSDEEQALLSETVVEGTSMRVVGERLGLSREAVRLRREKSLRRLRLEMNRQGVAA